MMVLDLGVKSMVAKRIALIFILALSMTVFTQIAAFASSDTMLPQAYINENIMDLFLSTKLDGNGLSVKVANQEAKIYDNGTISDKKIDVRTTILVDISTSMPKTARSKVAELIGYKIKNIAKNEQLRIVTFGEEIKVLQDFSSDRYDLDKAAENIKFDGRESAIYDAVYKTLPKIQLIEERPCFYRTIVLTDGADYATQGITKEELFMQLHSKAYPIDVVCVSEFKPSGQNKDLSALARISNGRYFDIYSEADVITLCSDLSVSNYFWIRAEVPASLLDGSTRQVDVSNGSNSISFDMKMSVVDAPVEPTSTAASTSSSTIVQQPVYSSTSETSEPTITDASNENPQINTALLIVIIASVLVVAAVGVIVVIVNKNKKNAQQSQTIQQSYPVINSGVKIGETEIVEESDGREHYSIKISNTVNQNDSWILDVFSDIIIGRSERCDIIINEKSVSREQCKIVANKNGLVISNLSSSNKTKLNGTVLATEVLLHPADNIHFGRVTLRVDYIQKVTDEVPPPPLSPSVSGVGKTQSIF